MEFKELIKKDAQVQLAQELSKLLQTCPTPQKEATQKEFEGFEKLFGRFINESGPSVEWDKIQRLHDGAVSPSVNGFYNVIHSHPLKSSKIDDTS